MKKRLLSLMLMVITVTLPTTLLAQATAGDEAAEPYAVLSDNNTVLTFYYDDQKAARGGIAIGSYGPANYEPWYENRTTLTTAVFDESFANDTTLTSTAYWFHECIKLTEIKGLGYLKTDKVTDMRNMFYGCSKLTTLDVSHFKTGNVTNMNLMFYYCSGLTSLDVKGFNTENVTDMGSMFNNCSSLKSLDISSFKTEKVKNMIQMFYQCYNLTTIYVGNGWSTASVTADYGYHMFTDCTALVGGMGTTYDENHVDFTYAHIDEGPSNPGYLTEKLDYNDGDLFTAKTIEGVTLTFVVTNASEKKCFVASNDRNTYMDTSTTGVVTIPSIARGYTVEALSNGAFKGCASVTEFKLPETLVLIECDAFRNCTGLTTVHIPASVTGIKNQPLPWPGCTGITSITVDPENPIFDSRDNCNAIFTTADSTLYVGCKVSTIPESTRSIGHSAFDSMGELPALVLPAGLRSITAYAFWACSFPSVTSYIEEPFETSCVWDHLPEECPLYVPKGKVDAYRALSEWNNFTTIVEIGSSITPEPYAVLSENNTVLTFYYDEKKTARAGIDINSSNLGDSPSPYGTATSAVFDASFANYYPTSTAYWFQNCSALTSISGIDNLKTDNVTSMYCMFWGCSGLTSLDLSGFNTDKVEDMGGMFVDCSGLTSLDLSGFNTANVTGMNSMFADCSSLTSLDLSGFNTANVTDMGYVFRGCSALTSLDVSSYKTEKVTNMYGMFWGCSDLTSLDLSDFNTSNVTDMTYMFIGCSGLKTIYVGNDWSTASVIESILMFSGCTNLVGGMGTVYNPDHVDATYAHIDGGASNPGYLTDINGSTLNDGETFTAVNSDGIELRYRVISAADKTCQVGDKADSNTLSPDDIASAVDTTVVGVINVPEQANGYKVIRVGYQAFVNCRNVTEVVLPNTVTELYLYSFAYSGIKRFTLPRSVSIIHYAALTETDSLETIIVDSENPVFDSRNNCNAIIETASNTLVRGCITSFVPDGITAIGSGAFLSCCAHDWTIELPNSVTRIETQAFNSCDLTDIKLPNNLQYVGYSAFGGSKLTSVVIPASVTEMGIGAFNCNGLTSIVVEQGNQVYDSRDNCNAIIETATNTLFEGFSVTVIPNSVTAIGSSAFREVWNLHEITIPESVAAIGEHAFIHTYLEKVTSERPEPVEIPDNAFSDNCYEQATLYVPQSSIEAYSTTGGWKNFKSILAIVEGGTAEPYAVLSEDSLTVTFYYDDQKTSRGGMDINNSILDNSNSPYGTATSAVFDVSFDAYRPTSTACWFENCSSLATINGIEYLHTDDVTNMSWMFECCFNLEELDLSNFNTSNVTEMYGMFLSCQGLKSLNVSSFNTSKVVGMNQMFCGLSNLTNLDLSNFDTSNVRWMYAMFADCPNLTSLDISSFNSALVSNMGDLFSNCVKLKTIYVGDGWATTGVEENGDHVFDNCPSLVGGMGTAYNANHIDYTYAHIDGGVSNPGYFTDKNAPVIDDNIIQFADAAVKAICVEKWDADGDGELSKAEAAAVTSLNKAFNQNDDIISFEEFQYFTGVTMLVEWEFHDCSNLKKIVLPPHLQSIEDHAFYYCGIDSIVLPASVTNITDAGMYGCFKNIDVDADNPMFCSIDGVLFSKDATVIRNYPVRRYDESYTVPSTVTAIGGCAFYGSRLREIVVPDGVTRFEAGAFRYCRELENIVIPATVDSIFSENFQYCDALTSVMIPANVKYMADDVLTDCSNLKEILVDADNQNYRSLDGVLYDKDVTRLRIYPANYQTESYVVPDGVTSMSFFAFNRAENIQAITLPQSLTNISHFGDSKNLTSVTVHWQEPLTLGANTDYFHENTLTNGTLYVPYGTKSLYEQTEGWNKFQNIVEMEAPAVNVTFDNHGVLTVGGTATMAEALETVGGVSAVAETVTAVVWNSTATLTNSDLQDLDNPNMLVYVPSEMQAPVNRDNVIIGNDSTGYTAKNIVLTDVESGNQNFYCPKAFVAEMITYAHDYLQQTEVGVSRGWETIALPFTVQTIMHEKQGVIAPFGNDASNKHFWLRQLMMQGLTRATVIEANMPYLIAMPNSDAYAAEFNLNGRVTFSSQNVEVPQTQMNVMEAHDANDNMMMFVPCFQAQPQGQEIYALNVGEQRDNHPEGSVFEANYREVRPFEAYTVHKGEGPAPRFVLITEIGGTTGIEDVRGLMSDDRGENWYDLNGRRLQSKPSQKGVYLHDGRKVVIR